MQFKNGNPLLTLIKQETYFQPEASIIKEDKACTFRVIGFLIDECGTSAMNNLNQRLQQTNYNLTDTDYHQVIIKTYNQIACEQVGGHVEIFEVSKDGIKKVSKHKLSETNIKYYTPHLVAVNGTFGGTINYGNG